MKAVKVLSFVLFIFLIGCSGKITDEDLELWSNSPVGWEKIEEICNSPEVPIEIKVKALKKLVVKHHIRVMKDILFSNKDKVKIAHMLKDELVPLFKKSSNEDKRIIKDGLFIILRYMKGKDKEEIQKMIADWAFEGLSSKDKTEKIKNQIEKRITLTQITELGKYGIDGAILLVSRGFGIEKMFKFIQKFKNRKYLLKFLDALKHLHKLPNIEIPPSHLQMIVDIGGVEAILYLIDIYYNNEQEDSLREDALALAINLMDKKEIQETIKKDAKLRDLIIKKLKFIMAKRNPENRRLAAHYILKFGGFKYLSDVLDGMKDDKTFNVELFETKIFMKDFCRDDIITLKGGDVVKVLVEKLKSNDRVVKTLSMICLKMMGNPALTKYVKRYLRDKTDINDIIGGKMTIGDLAKNFVDSMRKIKELEKLYKRKKISKEEYEVKKQLYLDELEVSGKALKEVVDLNYKAYLKKKSEKKNKNKKSTIQKEKK